MRVVQAAAARFGHRSPLPAPTARTGALPFPGSGDRAHSRSGSGAAPDHEPAVVADPPRSYDWATPGAGAEPAAARGAVDSPGLPRAAAGGPAAEGPLGTITAGPASAQGAVLPDRSAGVRYIGQSLGMFLLVEIGRTLYFVDQHAAHERVLFERLRRRAFAIQQL